MNPPTMSMSEIQTILGVSRNRVKSIMKNQGVVHDGTSDMRYPWNDANAAIEKSLDKSEREKDRRAKISEHRKHKKVVSAQFISQTLDIPLSQVKEARAVYGIEDMTDREFLDRHASGAYSDVKTMFPHMEDNLTKRDAACQLGVNKYQVKEAIRYGVIRTDAYGRIPEEELLGLDADKILSALDEAKESSVVSAAEIGENLAVATSPALIPEQSFDCAVVQVNIPKRSKPLEYVGFHLGPTNSGKTYQALENLCAEFEANPQGRYVYSGPLRMLAYEVYTKLSNRYGKESVGFITGEESVNPDAPILAATVEMTPMTGDVVIVDEAHWILDTERGHYWTRLLAAGDYRRMDIIAAQEAAEGLSALVSDALHSESNVFKRRTGISFDGGIHVSKIPNKTAVVCFSRKDVYEVYDRLLLEGKKACVLYGALPVEVRKKQIQDYENGIYDIVVTTNVIGHGINLPIDNVVFAGTERFDGEKMIELPLWEAGQISGRAGRYGLSDKGRVLFLEGMEWMVPDSEIARNGVNVAAGRLESGLEVDRPFIAPTFAELGLDLSDNKHLVEAVEAWSAKTAQETFFLPAPLSIARKNIKAVAQHLQAPMRNVEGHCNPRGSWTMKADTLWTLVSGPFDPRGEVLLAAADWLNSLNPQKDHGLRRTFSLLIHAENGMSLDALEEAFKAVSEFKMLAVVFAENSRLGSLHQDSILEVEAQLVEIIQTKLDNYSPRMNRCAECRQPVSDGTARCKNCRNSL